MIITIAARELRSLLVTPLAWLILVTVQLIGAWVFLVLVEDQLLLQGQLASTAGLVGVTDLVAAPLLRLSAWLLLLVVPVLSMRLIAAERRHQTLPLLLSSPLGLIQLLAGKYLALMSFLGLLLAMLCAMPLSLYAGADLDTGKLAAGMLGLVLVSACFAAVGLYLSSVSSAPSVAAFGTLGTLLLFWLMDAPAAAGAPGVLAELSLLKHFERLLRGVFDSSDVIYLLLFAFTFLALSLYHLDRGRQNG